MTISVIPRGEATEEAKKKEVSAVVSDQDQIANLKGEIESLKRQVEEERSKSSRLENQIKYLQADFENYRRRVIKEIDELAQFSNENLVSDLIEVLDELSLAVDEGRKTDDKEALLKGVEMTLKKLKELLGREGLAEIESVGKPFDPRLHFAAAKVSVGKESEGLVVEEIRKGFSFKGKVIRPSLVKVGQISQEEAAKTAEGGSR